MTDCKPDGLLSGLASRFKESLVVALPEYFGIEQWIVRNAESSPDSPNKLENSSDSAASCGNTWANPVWISV